VGKPLHVVLETTDLAEAHGQVRAGLEQAGCEVSRVRRTEDGFRLRGVRSGHGLATIAALIPPLRLFGAFSRTEVEAKCQRSLEDGDESLHVWIRARAIRELDDQAEAAWVTRGPDEAIGDSLQTRRVLKRLAEIFEAGVDAAPVEIGGSRGARRNDAPPTRSASVEGDGGGTSRSGSPWGSSSSSAPSTSWCLSSASGSGPAAPEERGLSPTTDTAARRGSRRAARSPADPRRARTPDPARSPPPRVVAVSAS
jgi:hypothetical protein